MKIKSSDFNDGGEISTQYTCEGENISPPLSWEDVPDAAKSLVLIIDDPDAPDPKAPKMVWDHWLLYNIDPKSSGLKANTDLHELPTGTLRGTNSWKNQNYGGPCPPIGRHRYFHKLFALNVILPDLHNPTSDQLRQAMTGHVIDEGVLIGTYQKKNP